MKNPLRRSTVNDAAAEDVGNADPDGAKALASAEAVLSRARSRQIAVHDELNRLSATQWARQQVADGQQLDAAARALLAGDAFELPASIDDRIKQLVAEKAVVEQAVMLARQRRAAAKKFHAARIVDRLRPQHRAAAQRIAAALQELAAANAAELDLHRQVPGGGAQLPPASFPNVGPIERFTMSPAATWFENARRLGLIDDDVPRAAE